MSRKVRFADCDPRPVAGGGVSFDCPEANGGCGGRHAIPGDKWRISGELESVTITPSIRCRGACRMHIQITRGGIHFYGDSKRGPEWAEE